ncbi:MAG: tetratricopeptide repeat protein [Acidobacteriota bacterium]
MRKTWWWISMVGVATTVALGVAGYALWSFQDEPAPWTTRSPKALEAFDEGIWNLSRFYFRDAVVQFERALELDPDFPMARLHLALLHEEGDPERDRLMEGLATVNAEGMTEMERWLLTYWLTRHGGDVEGARTFLVGYLEGRPDDAYARFTLCGDRWMAQDWDAADACYRKLIEMHPNWVLAQSRLGYIAMARGRFDEAEEHFLTYRYIAPDQAAPYGSLGQLLTIRGRYDEARDSLGEALAQKGDYCEAHVSRVRLSLMAADFDGADQAIDQLEGTPGCGFLVERGYVCDLRAWRAYLAGRTGEARKRVAVCRQDRSFASLLIHRMAAMGGDLAAAEAEEALAAEALASTDETDPAALLNEAILLHLQGVRTMVLGDWGKAAELLESADRLNNYWGLERAIFKLFNRLNLIYCLERAGRDGEAEALREQVEAVNPRYLEDYRLPDLEALAGGGW